MIATLFIIFAFIRAFPWSRRRAYSDTSQQPTEADIEAPHNPPPLTQTNPDVQTTVPTTEYQLINLSTSNSPPITTTTNTTTSSNSPQGSSDNVPRKTSATRRKSSKSIKYHEVTFSGSVGGGDSDSERTPTSSRTNRLVRQPRSFTGINTSPSRATSPESNSSSNYYRSALSSRSQLTRASSDYETAASDFYTARSKSSAERDLHETNGIERSSSNGYLKRGDTLVNSDEEEAENYRLRGTGADADNEAEADDSYDRDTEEFYSNIQDAAGTSGTRSKRSSLFSRSDSSATTTSSSGGTFTGGKRRSTASIISTSMCSDIIPIDRRRSSTATEYSVRSVSSQPRRLSGRIRRHISRMTIAGARRRTTGRYIFEKYFAINV
ncbi:cAMP-specific 3',5'-cyclic phosphodiesterase, isoforms N/G-like [Lucilia cuprina]|uniref:cAMP-specific 3',5'-cyclic phosphodiesterase, isoforms N/G-like n=1 Tax=Lucilia cuprina TaxID=7375 RepID=UPI001F06A097|nr:cAMP-specific 3',5'-cyclic phosphodiesterase, isoforms N/G-like [Lucilia cuprina]